MGSHVQRLLSHEVRDPSALPRPRDRTGNLPPLPGIFPHGMAPVVRTGTDGERELAMLMLGASEPTSHSSFSAPPSFLGGAF
jgi:hypothetical protein